MKYSLLVLCIVSAVLFVACTQNQNVFTISEDGTFAFDACQTHGLGNSVIMVESEYCGHCKETRDDFQAACDEKGVDCQFWDIAETDGLKQLEDRNLMVRYTPTILYGCSYRVGADSKDGYLKNIEMLFLGEE